MTKTEILHNVIADSLDIIANLIKQLPKAHKKRALKSIIAIFQELEQKEFPS